ncbi:MAG: hypothetical protein ACK55I_31355 [bacterium]
MNILKERERRLDFVPEKSKVDIENVQVDQNTKEMLKRIGL